MTAKPEQSFSRRTTKRLLPISKAANFLGVSIDTLRNYEEAGLVIPFRSKGGIRRYSLTHLRIFQQRHPKLAKRVPQEQQITKGNSQGHSFPKQGAPLNNSEPEIITISSYPSFPTSHTVPKYIKAAGISLTGALASAILLTSFLTAGYLVKPYETKQVLGASVQSNTLGTQGVALTNSITSAISALLSPFNSLAQGIIQTIQPETAKELGIYQKSSDERFDQNEQAVLDLNDKIKQLQKNIASINLPSLPGTSEISTKSPTKETKRLVSEDAFIGEAILDIGGNIYPTASFKGSLGTSDRLFGGLYTSKASILGSVVLGNSSSDTIKTVGRLNNDLIPSGNGDQSLGDGDHYFKNGYINKLTGNTGGITSFTTQNLTVDSTANFASHLLPTAANSYDLGSAALTWRSLYLGTNATIGGDTAVNGGDLTSTATTFNLLNATVATLNIGGAGTTISLGAATGTTTINNDLSITGSTSGAGATFTGNINANGGLDVDDAFVVANGGVLTTSQAANLNAGFDVDDAFTVTDGGGSLTISDNFWVGIGSTVGRIAFDDQATDFVNILNANVGIGTTAPGTMLEVTDDIFTQDNLFIGSTTESLAHTSFALDGDDLYVAGMAGIEGVIYTDNGLDIANGALTISSAGAMTTTADLTLTKADPALIFNTTTATDTDFWIGIQEDAAGDDDDLLQIGDGATPGTNPFMTFKTDGNIGIGTTNPELNFNVVATGTGDKSLAQFYNSDYSNGDRTFIRVRQGATADATTSAYFGQGQDQSLYIINNNLTRADLVINSAGNVGIGTTAPDSFKLQVTGNIGPSADDTYDLGSNLARWQDLYLGPGSIHLGTSTTDEYVINYNTTTNQLGFNADGSGNPELIISSSGELGIGTTAPEANVHIQASGGSLKLKAATSGQAVYGYTQSGAAANQGLTAWGSEGSTAGATYTGTMSYATFLISHFANPVQFGTNSTVRMTIASDGNVGIGTTNPATKFDVNGTARVIGASTPTSGAGLEFVYGGTTGSITSYNRTTPAYGTVNINDAFYVVNGSTSGNIGIGTTGPGAKFDVRDGALILTDADVAHGITDRFGPTESYWGVVTWDGTKGGTYMTAASDDAGTQGFVLESFIGSTDPTDNIPAIELRGAKKGAGAAAAALGAGETVFQIGNFNTSDLVTVLGNGSFGIGTTSPGYTLDVTGTLHTTSTAYIGSAPIGATLNLNVNSDILLYKNSSAIGSLGVIRFDGIHQASGTQYTGPSIAAVKEAVAYQTALTFTTTDVNGGNTERMRIAGDGTFTGSASNDISDARMKTNIATVGSALDKIMQLRGVSFNWKEEAHMTDRTQFGVIAQEVEAVFPELVLNTSIFGDGYKSVQYTGFVAPLIEAIKEQQGEINDLIAGQENLANLNVNSEGKITTPELKTGKLIISSDVEVDVLTSLDSLSEAILGIQTEDSTTSAQLASLETEVASQSSALAELEANIASQSAELAQAKSDIDELKLTPTELLLSTPSATLANINVVSEATISGQLIAYQATIQDTFRSLGESFLGNTTVAGDFSVDGTLSLTGNSLNSISTLYIQNSPLATLVDFFNGLVTIDNNGALTAQTISADEVITDKLTLGTSLGSGTILAGTTEVPINTTTITDQSKILLTPTSLTGGQALIVSYQEAGLGFVVSIDHIHTSDIGFTWLIVESK